jgi:hypothetical protein
LQSSSFVNPELDQLQKHMKKIILILAILAILLIAKPAMASEKVPNASAQLLAYSSNVDQTTEMRIMAVESIFKKYNSPLVGLGRTYVIAADKYGVDWRLLPSISGLESSFGKFLMPESHNAYGWGGGYIYFDSWEDGINTINKTLRTNYMDKWGARDVWEIGPIYAESKTWSVRVNGFMEQIQAEYEKLSAITPNI